MTTNQHAGYGAPAAEAEPDDGHTLESSTNELNRHARRRVFSCVLLGEEPLAARCGEHLLERGHRVLAVVSPAPVIRRWAKSRGLPLVERSALSRWLAEAEPFDLLLCITHPNLIAPEDIARARVGAFNYHDGPLPRYAGMNCSAWALASGERQHAIVWHHLSAGLDAGDIAEWRDIPLDARETSLSLNLQASALATSAFQSLLGKLERGDASSRPQNSRVQRLEFSRHDRPPALGTLDFGQPAAQLDCLIRACDFGPYPNRFALAKVVGPRGALLALEATSSEGSGRPGQVLQVDPDGIEIACNPGTLRIVRWTTLLGTALTAPAAAEALGAVAGEVLVDSERGLRSSSSRGIAEAEPFFLRALRAREPLSLPFELREQPNATLELELPPAFLQRFGHDREVATTALLAFVLSGLCQKDALDLALVDAAARARLRGAEPLLYPSVPWRIDVDARRGFESLVGELDRSRSQLTARGGFLFDLVVRHPELSRDRELVRGLLAPVTVILGDGDAPAGTALVLRVGSRITELQSSGWLDAGRLDTIAQRLRAAAAAAAEAPQRPLRELSLLTPAEYQQQVFGWNDTARPFPQQLRLHDGFESQAASRPDAVALLFENQRMSFGEVESAANRVANVLLARGVQPGELVGLYVQRGLELVVAMLGIAKSGAAYVPLDTAYPDDRVHFMLEDAGCRVVIASSDLVARIATGRVAIDVAGPEVLGAPATRPRCNASAEGRCYTIYTSGSTGRPKGVVLTHRAVINTIDWVNRTLEVGPRDRLLFVTSPSFDLSVFDVFGALGAGAQVEIASRALLADPVELTRRLSEPGVTIWDSAPPALARLAPFLVAPAPASSLRCVMLSGDWIPVWLPGLLQERFAGVKVHSFGGATEAAIWSNHYPVRTVAPSWTSIPYGYPIQNCRYYVLDHHQRPAPAGITGDLHIGGVCLALGYLNRPELTTERFVADPFVPGERMYKTGDLARYWPDGTLEFLGRADSQVKIRGFRVELGEIETALTALPGVLDAVCAVYLDASDQKSLVAYLVAAPGVQLEEKSLRARLAATLPDFMLPSQFVVLPELPLSPNGKLDRKALPSPTGSAAAEPPVMPRNDVERRLVELWRELLKKDAIGIRDDFFDSGGHSLLAVLLIQRLQQEFGVALPMSRLLERRTIEGLAESIRQASEAPPSIRHLVALSPIGSRPAILLVAGIGGYAFTYQKFGALFGKDQPLYALQAVGLEGHEEQREYSIEQLADIYVAEVQRDLPTGPLVIAGFSFGALSAFALALQLRKLGREVPLLISFDGFAPGYPPELPWAARLRAHVSEFRGLSRPERREYLADRIHNLQSRALSLLGREVDFAPDVPLADAATNERFKNSWAHQMRARRRYRTREILEAALLLIRAEVPDRWAGTRMDDPLYGWSERVSGPITSVIVPGSTHTDVMMLHNQELIVDAIASRIDAWLTTSSARP